MHYYELKARVYDKIESMLKDDHKDDDIVFFVMRESGFSEKMIRHWIKVLKERGLDKK